MEKLLQWIEYIEDVRQERKLDKTAAQNHNIIRKWCLSILKPIELSLRKLSLRKKDL